MQLDKVAYEPYADPDEFIRDVTYRIWVDRDIDYIIDNYTPDSIVHGALGTMIGRQTVINGSLMRIATTPQHMSVAEDVVWEPRGENAFLSSHLVFASDPVLIGDRITNVRNRSVANCLYREGRMVEEWVVRDTLAQTLQQGLDPAEEAAKLEFLGYQGSFLEPAKSDVLSEGDSGPRPDDHRPECEMVLEFIDEVWNRRRLNRTTDFMHRDIMLHTIGDRTEVHRTRYQEDLLRLLAPFPEATFEVRDVQTNRSERYGGLRVAVMWKLSGTYSGVPAFGTPTGEQVDVLGVSQFQVHEGRIVREMRVYDELALRAQIEAGRREDSRAEVNIY